MAPVCRAARRRPVRGICARAKSKRGNKAFARAGARACGARSGHPQQREAVGARRCAISRGTGIYFQRRGRRSGFAGAGHRAQDSAPRSASGSAAAYRAGARGAGKIAAEPHRAHARASFANCHVEEYLRAASGLPMLPELSGDPALEANCCQSRPNWASPDLNLESQLKEIEQGLFDLLAQRPAPK